MEEILTALGGYSASQWIALVTGLAYVVLAAFEKPLCWPFGIVSCTFIAVDDFAVFQLYADGVLQIFYVIFGFIGLYTWVFRRPPDSPLPVTTMTWTSHMVAVSVAVLISIPVSHLLREYTHAAFSYLDTLTTFLSLWATWMLVKKVLENWLYWIVIDAVYVGLFWQRGGGLIAVLYGVYLLIAVVGFVQWRRSMQEK